MYFIHISFIEYTLSDQNKGEKNSTIIPILFPQSLSDANLLTGESLLKAKEIVTKSDFCAQGC